MGPKHNQASSYTMLFRPPYDVNKEIESVMCRHGDDGLEACMPNVKLQQRRHVP